MLPFTGKTNYTAVPFFFVAFGLAATAKKLQDCTIISLLTFTRKKIGRTYKEKKTSGHEPLLILSLLWAPPSRAVLKESFFLLRTALKGGA